MPVRSTESVMHPRELARWFEVFSLEMCADVAARKDIGIAGTKLATKRCLSQNPNNIEQGGLHAISHGFGLVVVSTRLGFLLEATSREKNKPPWSRRQSRA